MEHISVRQATPDEGVLVSSILEQAAQWLVDTGRGMWRDEELVPERIQAEVGEGRFYLALFSNVPAGCFRLDAEDELFWPECPPDEALYLHRLAVLRRFAEQHVADVMLASAKLLTRQQRRPFLRLDCEWGREKLYQLYEQNGFTRHSEMVAGPYHVMRWECRVPQT